MSSGVRQNLRDFVDRFTPSWLADNSPASPSWGFRFLWTLTLMVDTAIEAVSQAALGGVGRGSSTTLDIVGQARGMIRNQDESAAAYGARLPTWIDRAKENGSSYRLILAMHDYLRSHPRVRMFRRDGYCVTVETDRTITIDETTAWDWDSVSHPIRNDVDNPWYSDLFIVVYTTSGTSEQWAFRPGTLGELTGEDGYVLGQLATATEVDALKGLIQLCKSAGGCVRAVIWTSDEARFVPSNDASMPDGTWGAWSRNVAGHQVPSGRDLTTCRYWEPR